MLVLKQEVDFGQEAVKQQLMVPPSSHLPLALQQVWAKCLLDLGNLTLEIITTKKSPSLIE